MFTFKLFSIRAVVAPSATIFVILLYFFKIGIQESNEGPAPMMKIDSFSISFLTPLYEFFLIVTNLTISMIERPFFLNNQNHLQFHYILLPSLIQSYDSN